MESKRLGVGESRVPETYQELRAALIMRGQTVAQLAREVGVSRTAVYRAMHGDPWLLKLRRRIQDHLRRLLTGGD